MLKISFRSALLWLAAGMPLLTFSQSNCKDYYQEQVVALASGAGHNLYGTMTIPSTGNTAKVLIIIPGSGPTDEDGNQYGVFCSNTYKFLSQDLAKNGIASLRFDKRGVGASAVGNNDERSLLFDTYVDDVVHWIELLREKNRSVKIILAGHSEGALIGMLAAGKTNVDGYISIAGPGLPFDSIIRRQIKENLPSQYVNSGKLIDSLKAGKTVKDVSAELSVVFRPSVQPFLVSIMKYDPAKAIATLNCPILLVQGDNDLQIRQEDIQRLSDANAKAKVLKIENMNHVLKTVSRERLLNMQSYHSPTLPVNQQLVRAIVDFVK